MIYFSDFSAGAGFPDPIAPPTIDADYAYVGNLDTGQIYYTKDATAQAVPASLAKIVTALVVMQEVGGSLSTTLTVASGDLSGLTSFSQMGLQDGDVMTYQDLLYGVLLASGADACQALARVIGNAIDGGGVATFVSEMNTLAASLGMNDTSFKNTFGEDDVAQYSTAADEWLALKELADNATLAAIVDTAVYSASVTGANARVIYLSNSNPILEDEGVIGGKTGTYLGLTDPTIYNLANTWTAPNGERVGIVTLHSDSEADRQADQRAIIAQLPTDFPALAVSIAPDNGAGSVLLENETDTVLLEDGTSKLLLEG